VGTHEHHGHLPRVYGRCPADWQLCTQHLCARYGYRCREPTSTNLTALPGSVRVGGVVSLTSTVTSSFGTPTGAVTFLDGNLPLSVQPVDRDWRSRFQCDIQWRR